MTARRILICLLGPLLAAQLSTTPARADNQMGYRLLTAQEAASLPHNRGGLGMDVERSQQITDDGMTFDIIRVKQVRRGSAGAQAGFHPGDQIISVDGRVFPSIATFAQFVGSMPPGSRSQVDFIPANGGPQQAQRVAVTIGDSGRSVEAKAAPSGMSTGTKIAIGAGAVALLGCYEMGCFSHRPAQAPVPQRQ